MLKKILPLECEVLLEDVQETDHLGEDEDSVSLLPEACEELIQQDQLPRTVDELLQPLFLHKFSLLISYNARTLHVFLHNQSTKQPAKSIFQR